MRVLILQHPQEPDKLLGTARLAQLRLPNAQLKVGLSWPNLSKALGEPAVSPEWGVLFLGGKSKAQALQGERTHEASPGSVQVLLKGGKLIPARQAGLKGIVVLDGTWSQAKTLWWRNAWLLKLKKLVLNPKERSLYGHLRREPRRECLSTLEAIAEALVGLGESPEVANELKAAFSELLKRAATLSPERFKLK